MYEPKAQKRDEVSDISVRVIHIRITKAKRVDGTVQGKDICGFRRRGEREWEGGGERPGVRSLSRAVLKSRQTGAAHKL